MPEVRLLTSDALDAGGSEIPGEPPHGSRERAQTFRLTVLGSPKPAGSKRAFVVAGHARVVDANPDAKPWKQEVAQTARVAWDRHGTPETASPPLTGPLEVTFIFYRARPKSHYRQGKNAALLRPSAPVWPTTRPDLLKLARAVEDALTGIVWADDSQIAVEDLHKHFGLPERVEIIVRELPEYNKPKENE